MMCGGVGGCSIIKACEEEKDVPFRDSNGRCVLCKPGEVGLLVGRCSCHGPSIASLTG